MPLAANPLQPLIDFFEAILKFFHDSMGFQWGWSIVALTIVVRAALLPLTLKQFKSMQAMARHQPELKRLQEKYKGDRDRMNQEMMKFYRENKINPLASCLPMVAQLPVFISPALPRRCKYHPTCSAYAVQAIKSYGILRGAVLAAWRLLRCNPFSHGGYDPVSAQKLFRRPADPSHS